MNKNRAGFSNLFRFIYSTVQRGELYEKGNIIVAAYYMLYTVIYLFSLLSNALDARIYTITSTSTVFLYISYCVRGLEKSFQFSYIPVAHRSILSFNIVLCSI